MNSKFFLGIGFVGLLSGVILGIMCWAHDLDESTRCYVRCHSAKMGATKSWVTDLPRDLEFDKSDYDITPTSAVVRCYFTLQEGGAK